MVQKHQYIPIDFLLIAKSFLNTPTIKSEDVDLQKCTKEVNEGKISNNLVFFSNQGRWFA